MSRSKTTSIKRPPPPAAAEESTSRLGDLTRPIPVDKRVFRHKRWAMGAGVFALFVGGAVAAALLILPVQTWIDQGNDIEQRQAQLDELQRVNGQLAAEIERLETPDGAREAAREELGMVEVGEERQTVLPFPALPRKLPEGWPYNVTDRILDARAAAEAAGADGAG